VTKKKIRTAKEMPIGFFLKTSNIIKSTDRKVR
jgi:hypothetical protein